MFPPPRHRTQVHGVRFIIVFLRLFLLSSFVFSYLMGAQVSALRKDMEEILPRGSSGWFSALHTIAHYSVIPAIYAYGLVQAGEFTWNPVTLLDKILVA